LSAKEEPQGESERRAHEVQHLCRIAQLSRAGYYRRLGPHETRREDADLRDAIQRIALEDRHCGYRRIAKTLKREGLIVNAKRVLRLMREDNLLSLRFKPFVPRTTMSRHAWPIVPNLTRELIPTGLDQIWVADITYIRLMEDFVYLAVVLDAYSRKVVGWALDDHLQARLAIEALDMATAARAAPLTGLIHHSDRGVQYACGDYANRLEAIGARASMSRPANPYDNAKAESFMKTLKAEEVNAKSYATLEEARRDIGAFIDDVYNSRRLHSSIGYKPPIEFEAEVRQALESETSQPIPMSPN
jgi:transposase InsO family protein